RASPASSTAGVAAQKSRAAACAGDIAGSGSRRRIQRKIASVASTTTAAPLIRVQSSKVALSGVENSIGGAQLIPRASGTSQSIGPLARLRRNGPPRGCDEPPRPPRTASASGQLVLIRLGAALLDGDVAPVTLPVLAEAPRQIDFRDRGAGSARRRHGREHVAERIDHFARVVVSRSGEVDSVLYGARVHE